MTGAEQIQAERNRQMLDEHFDAAHDDEHHQRPGFRGIRVPLVDAAICYARAGRAAVITPPETNEGVGASRIGVDTEWWPWDPEWWKPSDDPIRNLVKAGALIAAEIDRLQRAQR